jgi:hypothetical protein
LTLIINAAACFSVEEVLVTILSTHSRGTEVFNPSKNGGTKVGIVVPGLQMHAGLSVY